VDNSRKAIFATLPEYLAFASPHPLTISIYHHSGLPLNPDVALRRRYL
jgi:hypothetical protein